MIKVLIFDYGGVISLGGRSLEPADRLAKNLDISREDAAKLILADWDKFATSKIAEDKLWENMIRRFGHHILPAARNVWNTYQNCMSPQKEVVEFLEQLKRQGYQLGLLSNVIPPTAKSIRNSGGYDIFDFIILSCEVGLLKPDESIYQLCLREFDVKSLDEVVFIDDQEINLEPARRLGIQTIHTKNTPQMIQAIRKLLEE